MNEVATEKTMTVKEVASAMGVSTDTIKNCIRRIMPNKMQSGKTTLLNEAEVACISKELKINCKVTEQLTCEAASQVKNTTTDLEILNNALSAFTALKDLYNRKEAEYQATIKHQKQQLIDQQPKVDAYNNFLDREQFCNFRDAAKYLGVTQTELMTLLKSKYIYKNSVSEYRCYSEFADYFTLRPFDKGHDKVGQQLMINIKGLEFFKEKLNPNATATLMVANA